MTPFWISLSLVYVAEMGDKTMLATVTIASQQSSFLGVWLGSSLGMGWPTVWRSSSGR